MFWGLGEAGWGVMSENSRHLKKKSHSLFKSKISGNLLPNKSSIFHQGCIESQQKRFGTEHVSSPRRDLMAAS